MRFGMGFESKLLSFRIGVPIQEECDCDECAGVVLSSSVKRSMGFAPTIKMEETSDNQS